MNIGYCFVSGATCIYIPADINYLFYNIQNPIKPISVPSNKFDVISSTHFNKLKPTLVLVHGGGKNNSLTELVRAATVGKNTDINLISVDWLGFQNTWKKRNITNHYDCAPLFGKVMSGFLIEMVTKHGLNYNTLSMTGHSLASKFCFQVLKNLPRPIKHFVGLESCAVAGMNTNFTEV